MCTCTKPKSIFSTKLTSNNNHSCAEGNSNEEDNFAVEAREAVDKIVQLKFMVEWGFQEVHGDIELDRVGSKDGIGIVEFNNQEESVGMCVCVCVCVHCVDRLFTTCLSNIQVYVHNANCPPCSVHRKGQLGGS